MLINQSNLAGAQSAFVALFQEAFNAHSGPYLHDLLSLDYKTDARFVRVPVVASMPGLRRWTGSKYFKSPRAYELTNTILSYEKSIELDRLDLDSQGSDAVAQQLSVFLGSAKRDLTKLLWTAIKANTWTGYDASTLLADSHPHTNSSGDNLTTSALSHSALKSGKAAMRRFQDEDGNLLDMAPTHLIVGPAQENLAKELTGAFRPVYVNASGAEATSSVVAATTSPNAFQGDMVVFVCPEIAGNEWAIADLSKPGLRPVVRYVKRELEPVMQNQMTDEGRFLFDKYRFSVEGDFVYGPGAWQTIYASVS